MIPLLNRIRLQPHLGPMAIMLGSMNRGYTWMGFPDQCKLAVFLGEHWDSFRVRVENLYLIRMQNLPIFTEKQSLPRLLPGHHLPLRPLAYYHELDRMATSPNPEPHTPLVLSIAASAVVSTCLPLGWEPLTPPRLVQGLR